MEKSPPPRPNADQTDGQLKLKCQGRRMDGSPNPLPPAMNTVRWLGKEHIGPGKFRGEIHPGIKSPPPLPGPGPGGGGAPSLSSVQNRIVTAQSL